MQISKKGPYKVQYKKEESEKYIEIDWTVFCIDWNCLVPYGKHEGDTLQYVKSTDEWYWNYIRDNNLIYEWGMFTLRNSTRRKKKIYDKIKSSAGEVWLDIRTTDEPCQPWDRIEDYIKDTSD